MNPSSSTFTFLLLCFFIAIISDTITLNAQPNYFTVGTPDSTVVSKVRSGPYTARLVHYPPKHESAAFVYGGDGTLLLQIRPKTQNSISQIFLSQALDLFIIAGRLPDQSGKLIDYEDHVFRAYRIKTQQVAWSVFGTSSKHVISPDGLKLLPVTYPFERGTHSPSGHYVINLKDGSIRQFGEGLHGYARDWLDGDNVVIGLKHEQTEAERPAEFWVHVRLRHAIDSLDTILRWRSYQITKDSTTRPLYQFDMVRLRPTIDSLRKADSSAFAIMAAKNAEWSSHPRVDLKLYNLVLDRVVRDTIVDRSSFRGDYDWANLPEVQNWIEVLKQEPRYKAK